MRVGFLLHVVDRFDDLDAAGLAAAAGVDLRLHHPDRAAELLRGLHRLFDAERGDALRHRHAEIPQHRLGLVLVDVHAGPAAPIVVQPGSYRLPRSGAIFWQASTRAFTALADFSNSARSALVSSSSTMRSTPLAPITTGTPT